jgi:hypothetical protein
MSWELRAATSLTDLLVTQGRHHEAADLLAKTLDRFTEGFDTADLRRVQERFGALRPTVSLPTEPQIRRSV